MKIMVITAHPDLTASRVNRAFARKASEVPGVYVRDLYREYPEWSIDVEKEQHLLTQHDRIVYQFPLYWYSSPPLLKKWFDDVFTYGWAFGTNGVHLAEKEFMVATTVGGTENQYRSGGSNWHTLSEFMKPIQSTVLKCSGVFLPIFGAFHLSDASEEELQAEADRYVKHIVSPRDVLAD
ncbi:NAD(P)H-dependent oxidoreductase [Paenibacillus sp. UNC499MF]|uniref:NAD(P)H-dependent oxidoreductase n=1 Tax=Paenibacillus sp. UNC499MF TaxID=1502751 RepID=UPI00089F8846|nr:NAD(P)H-dependent oxidoreductase [Paenibacillus sp. UNC499MF]SEG45165.1 glutathione-regulated potassium-efflux system ancillary protein KefG [Paenibacillus sp. UNC499MF]